ncbi:hypothetical protein E0715_04045 [Lactobacillus helveticus]|nr:hypothetical protein [Lactobacillus helveticus]MBW8052965.1 hypothetical protein [Lactobacillus helveticus]
MIAIISCSKILLPKMKSKMVMCHEKIGWAGAVYLVAWAIAISIILGAVGRLAINLAKAYAIMKKANHKG